MLAKRLCLVRCPMHFPSFWDSYLIPHESQARLSQLGFHDVSVWTNMEDSKSEVRKFLKTEVGIKQEGKEHFTSHVAKR